MSSAWPLALMKGAESKDILNCTRVALVVNCTRVALVVNPYRYWWRKDHRHQQGNQYQRWPPIRKKIRRERVPEALSHVTGVQAKRMRFLGQCLRLWYGKVGVYSPSQIEHRSCRYAASLASDSYSFLFLLIIKREICMLVNDMI